MGSSWGGGGGAGGASCMRDRTATRVEFSIYFIIYFAFDFHSTSTTSMWGMASKLQVTEKGGL